MVIYIDYQEMQKWYTLICFKYFKLKSETSLQIMHKQNIFPDPPNYNNNSFLIIY